jgi:hypothetical protein
MDAPELTEVKREVNPGHAKATALRTAKYEKLLKQTTDPIQRRDLENAIAASKAGVQDNKYIAPDSAVADSGRVAHMAGELTSVNRTGPNMYANTGATLDSFNDTQTAPTTEYIGDPTVGYYAGTDKYGRKLVSNPEYSQYMVEQGYAVPYNANEATMEAAKTARNTGAGLWSDDRSGMINLYNKRNAPEDSDGYFGNLVDAVQGSIGGFGASTADWMVDAANRISKIGYGALTDKSRAEVDKDWADTVRNSPLSKWYDANGNFVGLDEYKEKSTYGYDDKRVAEWTDNFKKTMVDP